MIKKIIESYINKLTINDLIIFSNKQGVDLLDNEVKLIYNIVKNDYLVFLEGNPSNKLLEIKETVRPLVYEKIVNLYDYYSSIYKMS